MKIDLNRHRINLFHGLAHEIPNAVTSLNIPKIVTICDVVYKHFPQSYPASTRIKKDQAISKACTNADGIIAISASTKQDLINFFSIDPNRISVIHPSCDERFRKRYSSFSIDHVKKRYGLPDSYILYVGSVTERKNILVACRALRRIPEKDRSPLVVVGKQSGYSETVVNYIAKHHLDQWVTFAQVTSNDDLPLVYQGAELFIYPSLYEGFGIPVLEALCCGLPVITSNVSSLPEAAGTDSQLIDPSDPDAIASAIARVLTDKELSAKMITAGYAHSHRFNGNCIARELNDFYLQFCAT
jgi:glycosyltransferase involved in cell wall biosynthesis